MGSVEATGALTRVALPADGPAIAIRDLAKSYGQVHAVRGVTFDVQRGEIFGFLGLNGAGKTTTIRILLDLLRPSRGQAKLFGFDCQRQSRLARATVGYMPGELGFYSDMTGVELLDLDGPLERRWVDAHAAADSLRTGWNWRERISGGRFARTAPG